jgi:hypothetical protein
MPEVDVRPETAEEGTCRTCRTPIWLVTTALGKEIPLDKVPDPEGHVEMVCTDGVWRAEVLRQVESLFEVNDRPRWRPHFVTCPQARRRRTAPPQPVPSQRKR